MQTIDLLTKLIPIVLMILQLIVLFAIKINDITHINKDLEELKDRLDEINKKLIEHEARISKIEGKLNSK